MRNLLQLIVAIMAVLLTALSYAAAPAEEITPHRYSFKEWKNPPPHIPPASACFDIPASGDRRSLTYYVSIPRTRSFPIIILCDGSTDDIWVSSVIRVHRYFLNDCLALNCGLITLEWMGGG